MAKAVDHPFGPGAEPEPFSLSFSCTEGGSDKVYHVYVAPRDGGWSADVAWGARTGGLTRGTKTPVATTYAAAAAEASKEIAKRLKRGYLPTSGSRLDGAGAAAAREAPTGLTGVALQLPGVAADLEALLRDPAWWAQEKHDGHRRAVTVSGGAATGTKKDGRGGAVPPAVEAAFAALGVEGTFDGELRGDVLHVFDVLEAGPPGAVEDLRALGADGRFAVAERTLGGATGAVRWSPVARTEAEKRALLARVAAGGGEGVVLRRSRAPYRAGRAGADGDVLKHKFRATLSAVVGASARPGRRSVPLELVDASGGWRNVGNVAVPASEPVPRPGSIVEVRFRSVGAGGGLIEPVYLGERDDVAAAECTLDQAVRPRAEAAAA